MAWYDTVGKMGKSFLDFTGVTGLIHDVSNSVHNNDPWYSDAVNIVKDLGTVATTPLRGAVYGALKVGDESYKLGGVARQWMEKGILDTPLMYNKFKNEDETYDQYKQRVQANAGQISLGEAAASILSPGKNATDNSGWLSDWTDKNLRFLHAGFDIFNPADRKTAFSNQWGGKILTGVGDLAASTIIDPLTATGFLGKGATIAAKGLMYDDIGGKMSRAVFGKFAMDNEKISGLLDQAVKGEGKAVGEVNFLANTDAKGQYQYWVDKKVTNPDAMAYLFGEAKSPAEVAATFRAVMYKDAQAMSEIAANNPKTMLVLDNMSDIPHPHREFLNKATDGDILTSEEYHKAMSNYIAEMADGNDSFKNALDAASSGRQLTRGFTAAVVPERFTAVGRAKRFAADTFAEPEIFSTQASSLHPAVKIVNYMTKEVPTGVFNVNDGDSYKHFNVFLREANSLSKGAFVNDAKEYADKYLMADNPGERMKIIANAEKSAMSAIFGGEYSPKEIEKIYAIYDSRRARAIAEQKNRGYLSYFDGDQIQHAVNPVLRSESANTVVIADIRKLKRAMDAHAADLPAILDGIDAGNLNLRGFRTMQNLDTINDIFKTSVLMRLGYTVRNLAENQLSMVAKGMALPAIAAAGGKAAVGRFIQNRNTDLNRLADHIQVVLGRKEDIGAMQTEMASKVDAVRSWDMAGNQLSKSILENLPTDLSGVSDYQQRILGDALSTLNSKLVYHGTDNSRFTLDPNRALATSTDRNIARRYTQDQEFHSVEEYLKTPSGKPGKLTDYPHPTGKTRLAVAEERLNKAKNALTDAQKGIVRQGREIADVTGLQRELYDAQVELRTAKAHQGAAAKRATTVNEATEQLRAQMIDAVNEGKNVLVKTSAGTWRKVKKITWDDITVANEKGLEGTEAFSPEEMRRAVFRIGGKQGKSVPVRVYGQDVKLTNWDTVPLELRNTLFNGKKSEYKAWVKNRGWETDQAGLMKSLRDNNFTSAVIPDGKWESHIALPEAIDKQGRANEVNNYLKKFKTAAEKEAVATERGERTFVQNRQARKEAIDAARIKRRAKAVSPYYDEDTINAMIYNGVQDAAENIARGAAQARADVSDMADQLGARIEATSKLKVKQRAGYGTLTHVVDGHEYTLPNAFEKASWFMKRTSAEPTWNSMVGSHEMAFTTGLGAKSVRLVQPNDPKYFEGWANMIAQHFRDPEKGTIDPVVEQILGGKGDEEILSWFKSPEGRLYANDVYTTPSRVFSTTAIKAGQLDEELARKIAITRGSVNAYLPDQQISDMLAAKSADGKLEFGAEDFQKHLMKNYAQTPEKLVPLNGLLVPTSREYRDQERIIDIVNRRVMRFLGSLPEDVVARHPMVIATYQKRLRQNIAMLSHNKGGDHLTAEELDKAVSNAREYSRQEMERTIFTMIRKTGASSSQVVRLLSPFYGAWENTMQRWGGFISDNPMIASNAMRTVAQFVHAQDVVDQNGNRVTDPTKVGGANVVFTMPKPFIDSLPKGWRSIVEDSFKHVQIPLQSLDVITQGQPTNPGIGPFAVLPAYLLVSQRPELEKAMSPFFPAGIPQSASDIFMPSAMRRLATFWRKDDNYVNTYNQMYRYEMYAYQTGKRQDMPTANEVKDRTNKFFFLRALNSLTLPVAVSPEIDFYQQQYRQLQQKYANYRDPVTKKLVPGMAETQFLQMYPDYFEATVSLSKNQGGLEPSTGTISNLRKHSNLISKAQTAGDPELIGFLANDGDGQYTFSQAAYRWEQTHGAVPGTTFVGKKTPDQLMQEANIKRGWNNYQNFMGNISAYEAQYGITPDDPRAKQLQKLKQIWVRDQIDKNLDWYSAYASPDKAKYERRAVLLQEAFTDPKWIAQNGNRPVVKNAILYLAGRKQIANMLQQRYEQGGSRTLTSQQNADLAGVWDLYVNNLTKTSPETEQFINRYFANDSVVL